MSKPVFEDALRLSRAERIELISELWASLRPDDCEPASEQRAKLGRRVVEYRANPEAGRPWREVIEDLRANPGHPK
jgi:putative addiction module component (TIGR02574 family)